MPLHPLELLALSLFCNQQIFGHDDGWNAFIFRWYCGDSSCTGLGILKLNISTRTKFLIPKLTKLSTFGSCLIYCRPDVLMMECRLSTTKLVDVSTVFRIWLRQREARCSPRNFGLFRNSILCRWDVGFKLCRRIWSWWWLIGGLLELCFAASPVDIVRVPVLSNLN